MCENLSEELKDILNWPEFEWQEFVLEEPVKAAGIMQELFEYVREELVANELQKAAKKAAKTGTRTDLQEYLRLRRNNR